MRDAVSLYVLPFDIKLRWQEGDRDSHDFAPVQAEYHTAGVRIIGERTVVVAAVTVVDRRLHPRAVQGHGDQLDGTFTSAWRRQHCIVLTPFRGARDHDNVDPFRARHGLHCGPQPKVFTGGRQGRD
jgi:hypothetical protein